MKTILTIKHLAQDFQKTPVFIHHYGYVALVFDYEDDKTGNYKDVEIRFYNYDYYKHTSEYLFDKKRNYDEKMRAAYNSLIIIEDNSIDNSFNHYCIYFDDYGVYECVAQNCAYFDDSEDK